MITNYFFMFDSTDGNIETKELKKFFKSAGPFLSDKDFEKMVTYFFKCKKLKKIYFNLIFLLSFLNVIKIRMVK